MGVLPERVKEPLRRVLGIAHPYGLAESERLRLRRMPPREPTQAVLFGRPWLIPDAPSFLAAHREIFVERQYAFTTSVSAPRIIDGGSNIGLATLYFARNYPGARIEGFEPDPVLHGILEANIRRHSECAAVRTHAAAIWTYNGIVAFDPDGADGGHVSVSGKVPIEAIRLADLLDRAPVQFLKLDIEGAECEVLMDCASALKNVEAMVVEYHGVSGGTPRLGQLLDVLERSGFRYFLKSEGVQNAHPLRGIACRGPYELQVNISCLRA